MFHDEAPSENHLERQTPLPSQPALPDAEVQRKRMLIALGILLVALVAVVLKDWDFWFPPGPEVQEAAFRSKNKSAVAVPTSTPAAPAHEHKAKPAAPAPTEPPLSATTERAALPPLEVEVVAGNRHINVPAKSNAIRLDVDSGATSPAASGPGSSATRSTWWAAVSLQALISKDGTIQELQILSGPHILAAAAREAVMQWHFKPFLQNGQPVETRARIKVNFTISTN